MRYYLGNLRRIMAAILDHAKFIINCLSAAFAFAAAVLWIMSARVEVWADGQMEPRSDNMVILLDGRKFDVTGTMRKSSRLSGYAAIAAAMAALFQAAGSFVRD